MKIRLVEGPDDDKLQGLLNRSITNQKLDDAEESGNEDIGDMVYEHCDDGYDLEGKSTDPSFISHLR